MSRWGTGEKTWYRGPHTHVPHVMGTIHAPTNSETASRMLITSTKGSMAKGSPGLGVATTDS